ncbi:MAG: class IV adenylate cyclase [Candidatus Helarchaeota archaeon]|nr:class IV adenylate cyclase [Candidatus Helarchaeota archaeon]
MTNLEIKANCKDLKRIEEILNSLDVKFISEGFQRDTYFKVPRSNLKLRETNTGEDFLIWYKRRKKVEPKLSEYHIYQTEKSQNLKNFLKNSFGIKSIVEKIRKVYLYKNVRIHLDKVKGLGSFIELEAVLSKNRIDKESKENMNFLVKKLCIKKENLVKSSYSEMVK